ncbi:MAG: TetR/AcrR family transcriptional regulator [Candidatus Limnocylindrales bacterium]
MSPRHTETRQRAIEVALELFAAQGYEKTSLREIADRLGITKAALYYHFVSKEALLGAIMESLVAPIDELVAWSESQPRTSETRREVLRRLAELLGGQWSEWIRFAQENQPALREHREVGQQMQGRIVRLFGAVIDPKADLHEQLRLLLALLAVYVGNLAPAVGMLQTLGIDATSQELTAAAMDVAMELVGER